MFDSTTEKGKRRERARLRRFLITLWLLRTLPERRGGHKERPSTILVMTDDPGLDDATQ